jgi:hypothetical protein
VGTSIVFSAVAGRDATNFAGAPLMWLGNATPGHDGVWTNAGINLNDALVAAGTISHKYLRVTIQLSTDETGERAPSLSEWRVLYDCLDSE